LRHEGTGKARRNRKRQFRSINKHDRTQVDKCRNGVQKWSNQTGGTYNTAVPLRPLPHIYGDQQI